MDLHEHLTTDPNGSKTNMDKLPVPKMKRSKTVNRNLVKQYSKTTTIRKE